MGPLYLTLSETWLSLLLFVQKNASPISLRWLGDYFDEEVYEFSFKLV